MRLDSSSFLRLAFSLALASTVACGDDDGGDGTTASSTRASSTGSGDGGSSNSTGTGDGAGGSGTGGAGGSGTGGSGTGGSGGGEGACLLAPAPQCNTMEMPDEAPLVVGTVGVIPEVSGGGIVPPGTYVLTRQIVGEGGTPNTQRVVSFSDGSCFTSIDAQEGAAPLHLSGTVSYDGSTSTVDITCPLEISVSPAYQVLAPVDGKVAYATLNGNDYREWLQL